MKIYFLSLFTLLLVCLAGCRGSGTNGDLLTFDLEGAIDNIRSFDLSDIAADIDFIPLDDTEEESLLSMISVI